MHVAVLDSPVEVGGFGGSGHHNLDFASWHELLLGDGQVLVHHPGISVFGEGLDVGRDGVSFIIVPPAFCVVSFKSGITRSLVKFT